MLGVKPGEGRRTLLAFVTLLLVVAAYTIVKSVRDAVFLHRFGITELSFLAIGLAFVAGVVTSLYRRAMQRLPRHGVIGLSHCVIAVSLGALWLGLRGGSVAGWLAGVLYVWTTLFGVVIVGQIWLLAADMFDAREARSLFGLVGAGATLGGLGGGLLARVLAPVMGSAGLLPIAGVLLLGAALSASLAWSLRRCEPRAARPGDATSLMELFGKPSFVRLLAVGLLLSTVVSTLFDWQLMAIAKHELGGQADALAAFFGSLFAYRSAASLVVQVVITGWLLRRFGVGAGRALLPCALLLAAVGVLFHEVLPVGLLVLAAGAKVADGGLRFAIDKAALELTWLPMPSETRERSKSFVDTVVDRFGTGAAGLLWLGVAAAGLDRPERVHWVAAINVVLVVGWLLTLGATQRGYVDAFRSSLARRSVDLQSLTMALGDAEAQRTVTSALEGKTAEEIRLGLYLLGSGEGDLPDLSRLLEHKDTMVRIRVLELVTARRDPRYRPMASQLLRDDDAKVVEAAVLYLRATAPADDDAVLTDLRRRSAALTISESLVALSDPALADSVAERLARSLEERDGHLLERIAVLGAAPADRAAMLLEPLLDAEDPLVVEAALKAAGRSRADALAARIIEMLDERRWRPAASSALADMGAGALGALARRMQDVTAPLPARQAMARIAGASRDAAMGEPLTALLGCDPPELSDTALRALARLNSRQRVPSATERAGAQIVSESTDLYRNLLLLGRGAWPLAQVPPPDERPFDRALREACDQAVQRIFSLLSMLHSADDIQAAYHGLTSPLRTVRAKSLEFLDNILGPSLRALLLPLFDDIDRPQLATVAEHVQGLSHEDEPEGVARLMNGSRRWLRAVACFHVGEVPLPSLRGALTAMAAHDDELAAVVRRSLQLLDAPSSGAGVPRDPGAGVPRESGAGVPEDSGDSIMSLTLVEKALKLRAVDVLKLASSEDLAYVAQIAEEIELGADAVVYHEDDPPDGLYVVLSGEVVLMQGTVEIGRTGPGEAFGSWALVDGSPRVATATTRAATTLLRVRREEFLDLLADRAGIVQAVFKAMVERIRSLAELAKG